jgi:hypothetical protein
LAIDDAPSEGAFPVFTDAELQCTRSGQVLADFKGVSAFGLNVLEAKKYEAQRAKFPKLPAKERQAEIRRLLGLPEEISTAKLLSSKDRAVVYETEKGILIPGLRFKRNQSKGPTVIYLPDAGLPADGKLPAWLDEKYKNHQEVWAFDLRGLGETAPAPLPKKLSYFGVDSREAFLAMHINRPLLGQRVLDVLSLLKAIKSDNVEIIGVGTTGPVVLHAAALDERIKEITLENSLRSWLSVVQEPISTNQLTNVVPGVLKVYDLPELERTLAPRPIIVIKSR